MRTKSHDSPSRQKLLDAAQELMVSKGFVASTVDEICMRAGLTKGSFFHYFESKEDLGSALLHRFAQAQADRFAQACSGIEDPLERVYRMIDFATEGAGKPDFKGCLVGAFAQEISETHPNLREICQSAFQRFAESVSRDLLAAKERHAPDAGFDAGSLGYYFLSLAQGSMLILKTTGDSKGMASNLRHFKEYLRTLFGR